MGSDSSKLDDDESKDDDVYDPSCIYYDDNGNLRYASGAGAKDRDAELRRIVAVDDNVEEEDKEWWIIDSTWVNAWLAYVHYAKNVSPAPGPVDNTTLLRLATDPDGLTRRWIPRDGLISAQKSKAGHYRRITKEAWLIYVELYPASGPEIRMTYASNKELRDDNSTWVISPTHFPNDKKKRKVKKSSTLGRMFSSRNMTSNGQSNNIQLNDVDDDDDDDKDANRLLSGRGGGTQELMEDHTITDSQRINMTQFFGVKPVLVAGTTQTANNTTNTAYGKMLQPKSSVYVVKESKPTPERWLFAKEDGK